MRTRLKQLGTLLATFGLASSVGLSACGGDTGTSAIPDVRDTSDSLFEPTDTTNFDTSTPETPDTSGPDEPDTTTPDSQSDASDSETDGTPPGDCNTFGCSCDSNSDCASGLCIESADGNICTRSCQSECPDGFSCYQTQTFGTDPVTVCVPQHTRICRPCNSNNDCQNPFDSQPGYCIPSEDPAGGSFCGSSCASRGCPSGYACEDVVTMSGSTAKQCMPISGECSCRDSWSDLGLSTACNLTNEAGSCGGIRSCGPNGLTECTGQEPSSETCDGIDNDCDGQTDELDHTPCSLDNDLGSCMGVLVCDGTTEVCQGQAPAAETCNGADDNCDGQTDEGTCDDSLACTIDSCLSGASCTHELVAGACLINGACFQTGEQNPVNACQLCDSAVSTGTWTQASGTCIVEGQCFQNGDANPNNPCQVCRANENPYGWSVSTTTCQIEGQCYGEGEANPLSPCQVCRPSTNPNGWTLASDTCNIGGVCFAAGVNHPSNNCQVCDPARSTSGWSFSSSTTTCDDGNACSAQSFCDGAGSCVGNTSCNDNVLCTQDLCDPSTGCNNSQVADGFCRIDNVCYSTGTANPMNPCQRCHPQTNKTAWSAQPSSVACDDGAWCTENDACNGQGFCVGQPRSCSDSLTCTTDQCNETFNICTNTLNSNSCMIGGACYAANAVNPASPCQACKPAVSTSSWSANTGASCNDGNSCTLNDSCNSSGVCQSSTWQGDSYEANNTSANAKHLANMTDGGNFPQATITNLTFSGPGDIDWYTYWTDDVSSGNTEPRFRLTGLPTNTPVQACIYFRCTNRDELPKNLDCGAASMTSATNVTYGGKAYQGCCVTRTANTIEAKFGHSLIRDSDMECSGNNDAYRALISVRPTNANHYSCTQTYQLEIGDD